MVAGLQEISRMKWFRNTWSITEIYRMEIQVLSEGADFQSVEVTYGLSVHSC